MIWVMNQILVGDGITGKGQNTSFETEQVSRVSIRGNKDEDRQEIYITKYLIFEFTFFNTLKKVSGM